ncbi:MAG TPA: hypothetical protein DCG69_05865 [Bacteroidales bacterium]|nr:hypothetical protein [Bacteroidales bacterium]
MKLKLYFKKESIVRSIATLASGTVVAQLIGLLVQPILRRIVPVEDFGAFAVYMSIVGILATVITLRYDMAVVIPEKDEKASHLVMGGIFSSFILSFFLFVVIYFFHRYFLNLMNVSDEYAHWFYFLPLTLFFAAAYRMLNNFLIRKKQFGIAALNKGIRRTGEAAGQTSLAGFQYHGSLILGELFGSTINFVMGIYQAVRKGFQWKISSRFEFMNTLKEYNHFPKFNIFPVLLNNAASWLPVLFITQLFSVEITGKFDLTRQVFAVTLSLISMTIAQVYLQRIAEMRNRAQKIFPDILKVAKIIGTISILGIVITLLIGPLLFGFVFGKSYEISGVYAQIMIFSFAIRLIVSPLSVVFVNLERLKLNALWQVFYFLSILSLLLFNFSDILEFLYANVVIDLIAYSVYFGLIVYVSKVHDQELVSEK